ncbi:MAG: YopT-type cysteine protease domain-containing protein [Pseudomonadota bacterium]
MSVLPNAVAIDVDLDMGDRAEQLFLQALMNKGACTKRFRQGSDSTDKGIGSVYHLRYTAGRRWGGVCKALCIYWMSSHANDHDFWSWLFDNNGHINVRKAGMIADMQGAYMGQANHAGGLNVRNALVESKYHFMKRMLQKMGLVERKTAHGNSRSVNEQAFAPGNSFSRGRELAELVAPEYVMGQAMYKQLSFHGNRGGHAVALWVAQDVMFFDPNFGEFWFEHVADFRRWFTHHFWEKSGYGRMFDQEYTVHCFGKSIGKFKVGV